MPEKSFFKRHSTLILTLIGVVIFGIVILYISPQRFIETLESFNPKILAIAIFLYSLSWVMRGSKFYLILKGHNYPIPLHKAICISMIGGFANIFAMLQLGDITRVGIIKYLTGKDLGRSVSPILVDMSFGALGLLLAVLIMLPFLGEQSRDWYFSIAITLSLLLIGIALIYFLGERISRYLRGKKWRGWRFLESLVSSLHASFHNKKVYTVLIISMIAWFIEAFSFSLLIPAPRAISMLAEMLGNVTKIVPVTPGGVGTFSAAISLIISLTTKIPYKEAFSYALAFHMMTKLVLAALGSFSLWAVKKEGG